MSSLWRQKIPKLFFVWFLSGTPFFWHILLASPHRELPEKQIRLLWSRNAFVWLLGHALNPEQVTELSILCENDQSLNSSGFFFKWYKILKLQVELFYIKVQWCWFLARTWNSWEKYQEKQFLSKGKLVFEAGVNWQPRCFIMKLNF